MKETWNLESIFQHIGRPEGKHYVLPWYCMQDETVKLAAHIPWYFINWYSGCRHAGIHDASSPPDWQKLKRDNVRRNGTTFARRATQGFRFTNELNYCLEGPPDKRAEDKVDSSGWRPDKVPLRSKVHSILVMVQTSGSKTSETDGIYSIIRVRWAP